MSLWSAPTPTGGDGEARGRGASEVSGVRAPPGGQLGRLQWALCRSKKGDVEPAKARGAPELTGAQILSARPAQRSLVKIP